MPHASLEKNTIWHLIADMQRLRTEIMGADKWLVFGGTWGSTLAFAYAQTHPEGVSELVLRGIFGMRRSEIQWFYQNGASWVYPDYWEDFVAPIPVSERVDLVRAYRKRLNGDDQIEQMRAARAWTRWEDRTVTLLPSGEAGAPPNTSAAGDKRALAFARIENHYFTSAGFMEEGQLIRDAHKLADIQGVIVQGRYDMCTPVQTAWELHRAWPQAEFHLVPDAGHAFDHPGILRKLVESTDRFASAGATTA